MSRNMEDLGWGIMKFSVGVGLGVLVTFGTSKVKEHYRSLEKDPIYRLEFQKECDEREQVISETYSRAVRPRDICPMAKPKISSRLISSVLHEKRRY